jgi:hypothetical protein
MKLAGFIFGFFVVNFAAACVNLATGKEAWAVCLMLPWFGIVVILIMGARGKHWL